MPIDLLHLDWSAMAPLEGVSLAQGLQTLITPYLACPELTANDRLILQVLGGGEIVSCAEMPEISRTDVRQLRGRMVELQGEQPDLSPLGVLSVPREGYVLSPAVGEGMVFLPQLLSPVDKATIANSQLEPPAKMLVQVLCEQATVTGVKAEPLFSQRERDVLLCLVANSDSQLPASEVAASLFTSHDTVKSRVYEMRPKLEAFSCGGVTVAIDSDHGGYWLTVNDVPQVLITPS